MKKVKVDGLEFVVVSPSDYDELKHLSILVKLISRNLVSLLQNKVHGCRSKIRKFGALKPIPREKIQLLKKLKLL